jgi:glycosyltransferase involved in cell wall biosynthesis
MRRADTIAFIKLGRFSHTNQSVLELLKREFPTCRVEVVDVLELGFLKPHKVTPLLWSALRRHGPGALANRTRLAKALVSTPEFFTRARAELLKRLSGSRYLFTFQTQGLFDASVPGTPHFVYTDHTHLANLSYPAFDRSKLLPAEWIEHERSIYRNAKVNYTMSSNISASLVEDYGCRPDQVECVYVGTNAAIPPDPVATNGNRPPRILFVGVAWERKGGPVLVEAFRRVRQKHPQVQLVVVGCAPRLNVPGCEVVGRVPLDRIGEYYRNASIFCVPTRMEPFGIVFLEAFAYGLPVVATRLGALPDFVRDDETGYLVPPDDVDALAARLSQLLSDPERCRQFGLRGRELVRSRYNWNATGAALRESILKRLA